MARKKISFVDYTWLRADRPENLMIITGLITFRSRLEFQALRAKAEALTRRFPRFRQRLSPAWLPNTRPVWVDDAGFALDEHLERVRLPAPADQPALQDLISKILSLDLDATRPLWHFYLVEDYQSGGSALVVRLHHALADGIALVHVLLSMTEKSAQAEPDASPALPEPRSGADSPGLQAQELLQELLQKGVRLLTDRQYARQARRMGGEFALAVLKLALRPPDPHTLFKGPVGIEKRAAWSEPFDLAAVKRTGRAYGCTVNDVLLSAMAGGLGRYLEYRQRDASGLSIRGLIPVNLRSLDQEGLLDMDANLGNQFGLIFLELPVGVDDPVERLRRLKRSMDGLKNSKEPLASLVILNLIGAVPERVENLAFIFFDTKGTVIMTNVPGPREQLYLGGAPIEMLMAWVPQSGRVALGVSIISYNGSVWVGVATDQGLAPDPEQIVAFFKQEYQALHSQAEAVLEKRYQKVQPVMSRLEQTLSDLEAWLEEARPT